MGAHSSADDPARYRPAEEMRQGEKLDALARLRLHARWRGVWTDAMEEEALAASEKAVTQVISDCERLPPPPVESMFDDVYERMPGLLRMQKEEYLRFLREKVIDLLSIWPYDLKTVLASVEKTGRLIVIQEAPRTCGFAAEVLAEVQQRAFTRLQAPPQRITGFDTPFPYALEDHYLPNPERVLDVLRRTIEF